MNEFSSMLIGQKVYIDACLLIRYYFHSNNVHGVSYDGRPKQTELVMVLMIIIGIVLLSVGNLMVPVGLHC